MTPVQSMGNLVVIVKCDFLGLARHEFLVVITIARVRFSLDSSRESVHFFGYRLLGIFQHAD